MKIDSRCGLHCTDCEYKATHGCGGCIETCGHPFHGECPVAVCCQNKGFTHCGECPDIPCELLCQYSCCDTEHGDGGERIRQCLRWKNQHPPIGAKGFTYSGVNLYSRNPAQVYEFYKKLGFRVLEEAAPDSEYNGSILALDEMRDEPVIWIWRMSDDDTSESERCHLVFNAENLIELHQKILQRGIKCDPPYTAVWGGQELILHDPDGNELLFL